MYAVELVSSGIIYTPSFMKIGTGVQAILRFDLRNLRGCNYGITDGWDLRTASLLRCPVIHTTFHKDCFSNSVVNGRIQAQTHKTAR
jgi:hypothetical protein